MNFSSDSSSPDLEPAPIESSSKIEGGGPRREMSQPFQQFVLALAQLPTPEEKIALGLQFMRSSISQEGSPRFREFWEARKQVLPSFRDNINPAIRSKLWSEYVELTVEARRLKEILEEQSSFAMEQIDLAIQALEKDVVNFEALLTTTGDIEFPSNCQTVQQKSATYNRIQRELNLLNTLASRLNGLRKEILKTEMRIRFKTKFFKRLSELGDHIFPKRKELIDAVSAEFEKDVDLFVSKHFRGDLSSWSSLLRSQRRDQSPSGDVENFDSKQRLLQQHSPQIQQFGWDVVKNLEKEHKKEVNQKRQVSAEKRQEIRSKIDELATRASEMTLQVLDAEIDAVLAEMRTIDLQREDVRSLREALQALRTPHLSAQEQKAREFEEAEKERIRLKREHIVALKDRIASLVKEGSKLELEEFAAAYAEVKQQVEALEVSKIEKQQIERSLRPLKDLLADQKERSLLHLSDDQRQNLENLRTVLQQKKQRRQEIKEQMETYRRALGSSGLDFEKAMMYRELADQEKESFDKANAGIEEVEKKIAELEG